MPLDLDAMFRRYAERYMAGANGVAISGSGPGAYLSIYAPQTSLALSGGTAVYGAVLGKTLAVSGGAAIHYDVQLVEVWADYFNP